MKFSFFELPIDFGHTKKGRYHPCSLAQAPAHWSRLLRKNFPTSLTQSIPVSSPSRHEPLDAALKFDQELLHALIPASETIQACLMEGNFPIVLGGDHSISLATATGISRGLKENERLGALVFDAHTDFNLPGPPCPAEADLDQLPPTYTFSGNAHGMIHALLGRLAPKKYVLADFCWKHSKLDPNRIVIVGVRAKRYPQLEETLKKARPWLISAREIENLSTKDQTQLVREILDRVSGKNRQPFYLSIDCDVLEPKQFPAVSTAVADGIKIENFQSLLKTISHEISPGLLRALDISEYAPKHTHAPEPEMEKIAKIIEQFLFDLSQKILLSDLLKPPRLG